MGEIEIETDCVDPIDAFEAEIDEEEEKRALRIQLDELRAEQD